MSLILYLIDGVIHNRVDKFGRLISPELRKKCNSLIWGKPNYTHQERIMARVKKAQVHICQNCKQSYVVHCHFNKIMEASAFTKKQFNYLLCFRSWGSSLKLQTQNVKCSFHEKQALVTISSVSLKHTRSHKLN